MRVWVSEIMLQQTQVATVIDYYNKWMKRWPSVEHLSQASLEEVNEMWSGLGYYSRGRRLHEGALKVMNDLDGQIPRSSEALIKELPGVGRYTAAAIASIALGESVGVVDGNVSRVLSRMRVIGADITSQPVTDALWVLTDAVVDPTRPGDFNQAIMELGATVCTPKAPQCTTCPVQTICKAYKQVEQQKKESGDRLLKTVNDNNNSGEPEAYVPDIECAADGCSLCFTEDQPWIASDGVMNYPRKAKKKAAREESSCVCVLRRERADKTKSTEYLMVQRPETGLLANLWEFPSVSVPSESSTKQAQECMGSQLSELFCLHQDNLNKRQYVTEVVHIFSHIHQTYMVETACLSPDTPLDISSCPQSTKWVTAAELAEAAVSTAMKKVFKAVENHLKGSTSKKSSGKLKPGSIGTDGKKQLGLDAFFKKKS